MSRSKEWDGETTVQGKPTMGEKASVQQEAGIKDETLT